MHKLCSKRGKVAPLEEQPSPSQLKCMFANVSSQSSNNDFHHQRRAITRPVVIDSRSHGHYSRLLQLSQAREAAPSVRQLMTICM